MPALFGITAIALCASGCLSRAGGEPMRTEPVFTKQALAILVAQSLGASGVPEPPLARDSTRAMRKQYLTSAEEALENLARLPKAPHEYPKPSKQLLLPDQSAQILQISKLLAVELADAIDRADAQRADDTLRLAIAYADSVAVRSIPDWTASGAIADTLSQGIKSVAGQLDEEIVDRLGRVLDDLEKRPPSAQSVLASDSRRILAWYGSVRDNPDPVPVERIPLIASLVPESRSRPAEDYLEAVKALAPLGKIPHDTMVVECGLSAEVVGAFLKDPRPPAPTIDAERHPIGALMLSVLAPTFSAAPNLIALRAENLRVIALTLRIAAAEEPTDLSTIGDLAVSPVSGLLFEYLPTEFSFDLIRPRAKVGSKP